MDSSVTIFVAHAEEDATLALLLKGFLEGIFLNASAFVSGTSLTGGATWFEMLRQQLDRATAILAIITPQSKSNPWVLFEAGAGVCAQKSIPILADGMTFESLEPPLRFLQGRCYTADGLRLLTEDIAKKAGLRTPTKFSDIDAVIAKAEEFVAMRRVSAEEKGPAGSASSEEKDTTANYDPELARIFLKLHSRAINLLITSIQQSRPAFDVPSNDALGAMHFPELLDIAKAANVEIPCEFLIHVCIRPEIPLKQDPIWKKTNARKSLEEYREALDQFEASLANHTRSPCP